jgi:hypothetical protein
VVPRVALPALLAAVLLVGGCGGLPAAERAEPPAEAAPRETRAAEPTPSPTSSGPASGREQRSKGGTRGGRAASPGSGGGKVAPALPLARADGARHHLLTAETLPEVGDGTWTERSTKAEGNRLVGACHRATLVDVGALHAVLRVFTGADGSGLRSRQAVARYADAKSAWRAHQVLRSWRADCEEYLADPAEVGPMEKVTLDDGSGGRYPVTHGPEKRPHGTALGIVRHGRWLAVVEIRAAEGDVPAAWTRRAVRRIAATW